MARGFHATVEGIAASRTFVNDANSASAAGYGVVNIRVGGDVALGGARILSTVGVQNLLDRRYIGSVSVNANPDFGRYYEPAPGRSLFVALTVGG
jgi:iron complex outermembrane receptor protein